MSNASGGPADATTIAKGVDADLVDIDTTLSYQDEEAAGTGMVLTSDGEILTNNHVIDGATSISVTDIGNDKTYSATVVGYDPTQDVAVLQLKNASGLKTVDLGDSSSVKAGESVVGIGNAGGTGGTPSVAGGSVSALDQSITASDEGGGNSENLHGLIETNANIQAGDSGGPLVTTSGKVVGMDTAAANGPTESSASSATTTQAYAIPINEATTIARQIKAGDATSLIHIGATGFLGVSVEAAGSATGGYGSEGTATSGAEIAGLATGSPAAAAGLAVGDTITSLNGHTVTSPSSLSTEILKEKVGASVQVGFTNTSGQSQTVTVSLASGPPQ